jgi:hypothetical protein
VVLLSVLLLGALVAVGVLVGEVRQANGNTARQAALVEDREASIETLQDDLAATESRLLGVEGARDAAIRRYEAAEAQVTELGGGTAGPAGDGAGLETLNATALRVAGPEAWSHVVSVEQIGPVLVLRTDWTVANVDESLADLVCGGVYTWMRDDQPGGWRGRFQSAHLYETAPPGEQVFAC